MRDKRRLPAMRPPRLIPDRRTALSRLLPLWPHELEDRSLDARRLIVGRLRRALRAERRRGIGGHWTYDLARHVELLRLYRAEIADLAVALQSHPSSRKERTPQPSALA
jgi:hypothetical protein